MNLKQFHTVGRAKRSKRGSATLVVLVFLTIMAVYVVANNVVLHNLKQEMKLVEKRQLRKYHEVVVPQVSK